MEHWGTITAERLALADQLEELTPDQWATPSLCGEWTVRDVVGHLVVTHETSLPRFLAEIAKARGNFDRANSTLAVGAGRRPTEELVAGLRRIADSRFKPPMFGSEAPLTDVLVHGRDIRIPLGLAEDRPAEPWRHALDSLQTAKARWTVLAKALPKLRFVATDIDWSHGEGDEVEAPAADLALTMMGRRARLDSLRGSGAAAFAAWVPAP